MRKDWTLPDEDALRHSGSNWVLIILDSVDSITRQRLMFLWWRTWHLRNDGFFNSGNESIEGSARFILNYSMAMQNLRGKDDDILNCLGEPDGTKVQIRSPPSGVTGLSGSFHAIQGQCDLQKSWKPPNTGWVKLNCDAIFLSASGSATWGAVLRSHTGQIISSAWGASATCFSAAEAEVLACIEGMKALCPDPNVKLLLECDCQDVISGICSVASDRSPLCFLFRELKNRLQGLEEFSAVKVPRDVNVLAPDLAQYARGEASGDRKSVV